MQFLTQKQQKYIALARQTPGNCGYVDVYQKRSGGDYDNYWSLMPEPGYALISFTRVINDNHLLIINQTGELRLFHLDRKQELAVSKINATRLFDSGLYPSQNKGFIFIKSLKSEGIDLFEFSLDSLKTSFRQTIQGVYHIYHTMALSENQLAGYIPVGSLEGINSSDSFLTIDTNERTHVLHQLKPSPSGLFPPPPVAFDPRTKTGIRPSYDPIEIIESDKGKSYLAKVLLFDLSTGKKIRNITVREFSASELFEDDDPEFALSCFDLPSYSEDYLEVKEEFLERFEAVKYCHREDAFWVTFQHGILRKSSLDGKIQSSLIAHPGDPDLPNKHEHFRTSFDTPLQIRSDDRYLSFGKPAVTLSTESLKETNPRQIFVIPQSIVLETDSEEQSKNPDAFSWITLAVDSEMSQIDTLNLILDNTSKIEALKDGPFFRFQFVTPRGILKEKEFVQKLAWDEEQVSIGRKIILTLLSFERELWYDHSTPALFYVMRRLVLTNFDDLGLLTKYIRNCGDCKAEKDSLAELIDEVINTYGWSKNTIDMILTRGYFQSERGLEQLENHLKQDECKQFHSQPAQRDYFRSHALFKTLAEDYFSMFFPNEDSLFSAIEAEDTEKVLSLLEKPLALDQMHPEYNMVPLDAAIETGNQVIIGLLKEAGAASKIFHVTANSIDHSKTNGQDISLDKAMDTLLSNLHRQQETIQKEIYDLQFSHMLNVSLPEEHLKILERKHEELEDIQTQIKFVNLGLISLEDLAHSENSDIIPQHNETGGANSFISDRSHAYTDLTSSIIEIENLGEDSQMVAFERMKSLLKDPDEIILNQVLRFNFNVSNSFFSEKQFYEAISLTSASANVLSEFIKSLTAIIRQPIWYDDEIPGIFFALQKLVVFNECYVKDLISYIKSDILTKEEPTCMSELIFDVYELYGWNVTTLSLTAARLCQTKNEIGINEFRLQWKKGGLDSFICQPEIKKEFMRLLDKYCCEERLEWFRQFTANGA